jgi:hypothetical protein
MVIQTSLKLSKWIEWQQLDWQYVTVVLLSNMNVVGDWKICVFIINMGNYISAFVWYPNVLIIVSTEMYVIKIILTKVTTSELWILCTLVWKLWILKMTMFIQLSDLKRKSENVYVINIFRYYIYSQTYSKIHINSDISDIKTMLYNDKTINAHISSVYHLF